MRDVSGRFENVIRQVAINERLSIEVTYTEPFPVTHNSEHLAGLVAETALGLGMQVRWMDEPFRWSEDFGHFSARIPSVLFGLGSGRNHPALHHPDYDFNDSLLEPGVQLMDRLSRYLLSEEIPSSPW